MIDDLLRRKVKNICLFRGNKENLVLAGMASLLQELGKERRQVEAIVASYESVITELLRTKQDVNLEKYIVEEILFGENLFAQIVEAEKLNLVIKERAEIELGWLKEIASIKASDIKTVLLKVGKDESFDNIFIQQLLEWESSVDCLESKWVESIEELIVAYQHKGYGEVAKYSAFIWEKDKEEGVLKGIKEIDPIRLKEIIGYEMQKEEVIQNTLKFLQGYPTNNLLLYGARGTGKSSLVKAILNEYKDKGLRLIEVRKDQLKDFTEIVRSVRDKGQKFIIFVDDLVFEDNEESYTALKTVLEGGVESKASNVVIYATSNRKHLVKEKFSDRKGLGSLNESEEVHAKDTMEEKLSLANRFGITLSFFTPNQNEYLEIIYGLAKARNLDVTREELTQKALKWEMWHNGKSGRTAKQFIDYLQGERQLEKNRG